MSNFMTGVSAFPITPADAHGHVDAVALRGLLARLVAAKVDSIGLLGSTGSYPYLSRAERRRAIETAADCTGGAIPLLVGIGALRTDEAVLLARDAKTAGATVGLLAAVSYTPLTDDEVFEHFATVARASGLPLCIYDNPSTTHFTFGPALIERLGHLPGIVAIKTGAPDAGSVAAHIAALREIIPASVSLGYSVDLNAVEALLAGGDAWYSVVAGLFPDICVRIVAAVRAKDAPEARRLNATLQPLWGLFREFTSLRVVYAAADLLGICHAAPPRPILPLAEPARQKVAAVLDGIGLR